MSEFAAKTPLSWETIDLVRRHESIVGKSSSLFVLVDVQEKLLKAIPLRDRLVDRLRFLLQSMRIVGVPITYSEQYPKGLGPTESSLLELMEGAKRIEKTAFSIAGSENFVRILGQIKPTHVIITGIEAHVCVTQSALDIAALGYKVSVPHDAILSRNVHDMNIAVDRMRNAGITITTAEALVFELLESAGTPEFREVLKLIK